MTAAFVHEPTPAGTEFRLVVDGVAVAYERWAVIAPRDLLAGVDTLTRLAAADEAVADADLVLVDHAAIAALSAREAQTLGLPPLTDAVARVETRGIVTQASFGATLQWRHPTGQPIVGAERVGAWLRAGGRHRRLSSALFAIAGAVDAITTAGDDLGARLTAIGRLREVLPAAAQEGIATTAGIVGTVDVVQADAFSLDLVGTGASARLVPILHRAGDVDPLLPPERQAEFGNGQFNQFTDARPVYTLPGRLFVVLTPTLRRCLSEVRRVQSAPFATKKAFLAAPRTFLATALEADADPTVIDAAFVETAAYSDRVIGLGLWKPRVVPWVMDKGTDWFGPDGPAKRRAIPGGLVVGDRRIALSPEEAETLTEQVRTAMARGEPTVRWTPPGEDDITIPSTDATLDALKALGASRATEERERKAAPEPTLSLLILTNEGTVEHQQDFNPRLSVPSRIPDRLRTVPKAHQRDGILWLQQSWLSGRPGVLLADDMGLGKTLQGLAFLAWIREAMEAEAIERGPVLIVAPTGLLSNWMAEHDRHLSPPGLGDILCAFGPALGAIRRTGPDGAPELDRTAIAAADWVLTTYETLRNYDKDFGAVRFAVLMADEAQKVKTPGARTTDALKAMSADFRVALTGTPVENRLADLWCIVDGIHSGWLGDLKAFSARYEAGTDVERLKTLKSLLDQPFGGAPALLLRRMKDDHLPDLPAITTATIEAPLPPIQQAAYDDCIGRLQHQDAPGGVLEALQQLRAISLHPHPDMEGTDEAFIGASARFRIMVDKLDRIAAAGEKALIFVDALDLQSRLSSLLQRRYGLPTPPEIISGEVAGAKRQERVDRFQRQDGGFDAMILSPRAGGVGLTLTAANHVIHLARWWNPAVEDQCNGRAHRIGQVRPVTVHLPIGVLADGRRSFDQNLHALLARKRDLMREALLPSGLDESDQQELFRSTVEAATS